MVFACTWVGVSVCPETYPLRAEPVCLPRSFVEDSFVLGWNRWLLFSLFSSPSNGGRPIVLIDDPTNQTALRQTTYLPVRHFFILVHRCRIVVLIRTERITVHVSFEPINGLKRKKISLYVAEQHIYKVLCSSTVSKKVSIPKDQNVRRKGTKQKRLPFLFYYY